MEEKGGPRVRDVLEQIVDLKSLRYVVSTIQHAIYSRIPLGLLKTAAS